MANVSVTRKDSMLDQIEQIRHRIAQRAYELFRQRDGSPGDPTADWLTAEREIVWKPAVDLQEKDGTFTIVAALPGVEAKDVSVDISPEDVVIKAARTHACSDTKGHVHQCEFATAELFRPVHFSKRVDSAKAKADYRDGLLTVTVAAAPTARAKRVATRPAASS
jgi:HSP20 family molecular chaperone IbpA